MPFNHLKLKILRKKYYKAVVAVVQRVVVSVTVVGSIAILRNNLFLWEVSLVESEDTKYEVERLTASVHRVIDNGT